MFPGMAVDADHPTTMAVVSVDAAGERDFSFYRSANADVMLCKEDISDEALKAAKIVHFGSVSLTADPSRTATLDAAARAKKLGAVITYDPNYRANLWKNKEDAIAQMKAPLPLVDILKVSDEELPLLTGTTDCAEGTAQLAQNGIRLIFVTLGANGVFYRFGEKTGHVAGVPCKVGDTNGAGDTFFGAALSKLCKEELDTLTVDKLESILAFANKAASTPPAAMVLFLPCPPLRKWRADLWHRSFPPALPAIRTSWNGCSWSCTTTGKGWRIWSGRWQKPTTPAAPS